MERECRVAAHLNWYRQQPKKFVDPGTGSPQLPRSLDDQKVSIAIINNTFAAPIGLVARRDGIFVEDEKSPYVNIIVSRDDNKEQEKVRNFVKAYQSPEVEQAAEKAFEGGAIKGW